LRTLTFRAGGKPWAIDAREVLAVQPGTGLAVAPGAPDGVVGIAAFRGDVVTVVAIPGLDRADESPEAGSIVRLAPPREHLAFWVPGPVALADAPEPDARLFDPHRLG
jgi:hypothetical protein